MDVLERGQQQQQQQQPSQIALSSKTGKVASSNRRIHALTLLKITFLGAICVLFASQLYGHVQWLQRSNQHLRAESSLDVILPRTRRATRNKNNNTPSSLEPKDVFGGCLMFKDDLTLLPEWLAYHYTVLPLRFLFLGTDVGNQQDPQPLLETWHEATDLRYKIIHVGNLTQEAALHQQDHTDQLEAHHAFVNRQRLFVQACTLQMQDWQVQWTAYVDSDEYVTYIDGDNPIYEQHGTLATTLQNWQAQGVLNSSCYTMPRLRYGAVETVQCPVPDAPSMTNLSPWLANSSRTTLTTQRFVQHARPDDFQANRFGKVLMNVSALPRPMVESTIPFSIHRPYKDHCGRAAATQHARLRANHYVGSADRFLGRANDIRRTAQQYQQLSQYAHDHSCHDSNMQTWVSRFVKAVSASTAQRLLWPFKSGTSINMGKKGGAIK